MNEQEGKQLLLGGRVVHMVSGYTGEIRKVYDWGVQCWVPDRGMERENWSWAMITIRIPRLIKRYPRPWRFPREEETQQCHCKVGKMVVEAPHTVRCTRCSKLVGSEAYPNRIERATEFLRKAYREPKPEVQSSPNLERTTHRKSARAGTKKARKIKSRVGVRPTRRGKEKPSHGKSRSKGSRRLKISTHPKVPKTQKRRKVSISKRTKK